MPFEAHTTAKFGRIGVLFERACASSGLFCVSRVSSEGNRTTWTVELLGETEKSGPDSTPDLLGLSGLKIVLVEGRLVEATGFTVEGDRTATLGDVGKDVDHVVLGLTWEK